MALYGVLESSTKKSAFRIPQSRLQSDSSSTGFFWTDLRSSPNTVFEFAPLRPWDMEQETLLQFSLLKMVRKRKSFNGNYSYGTIEKKSALSLE